MLETEHAYTLRAQNLGHKFGPNRVFSDISFELSGPGSIVIAGSNGAGKSTLMRILCGLLVPTRGCVEIRRDGTVIDVHEARGSLGVVAPELKLYGELTALENLVFFGRLRGLGTTGDRARELLERADLVDFAEHRVGTMSQGQRQRMKYLCATLHDPPLLFLDEPTVSLDEAGREFVSAIVARQRSSGILVVATNEKEEYVFGDRIIEIVD